jgi:membrane associated rhomboid family serine protease
VPRGQTISFSFPPFAGWVRRIIIACAAIYLLQAAMRIFAPGAVAAMNEWLALIPVSVMHGKVWQVVTYSLLHASFSHVFFNMLTLWFIGAYLESDWGPRRFIECYIFCVVGAALVTIAIAYTHFLGADPRTGTVGASGGIFGLLMAFGILYADQEMYLFPLPFRIKAKYLVGIWVVVAIIAVFEPSQGGVAVFAHLGGLAVRLPVGEVHARSRHELCSVRALFRRAQLVLPLEAKARGQKVRSLHERPRPQSHLR